jgi:hypothetical protein
MPRHSCRVCWNTAGWTRPTGDARNLEDKKSYVSRQGFGHEEWLFSYDWLLDDLKYGHLQPVSRSRRRLTGSLLDLFLYAFGPDRRIYAVGTIDQVRVIDDSECDDVLRQFHRRGWLNEMVSDLRALGIDPAPILEAPGPGMFNVAFEPGRVQLFDPMPEILQGHPNRPKVTRYVLTLSPADVSVRSFSPKGSITPTKKALLSFRGAVAGGDVEWRHTSLQNQVHEHLSKRGHQVLYESSYVDLSLSHPGGDVLFELKTAPTARACIREGLGQLLEYAHYASTHTVKLLVVVGRASLTEAEAEYLEILREEYRIPLAYWRFCPDEQPDVFPRSSLAF